MEISSAASSSSLNSTSHRLTQTAKRKFFQWAVKWFYANMSEDFEEKPDAPLLASLLQSIGFQLREFGKNQDTCKTDKQQIKNESIRVIIECGTSGMRACLEMDDVKCQCPNSEIAEDASFWSSSGTGPAARVESTNKIEDSGSNLLPFVSKGTKKVLSDVIYRLLKLVNDKSNDINLNSTCHSNINFSHISSSKDILEIPMNESIKNNSISIYRSHTQPEFTISGENSAAHRYKTANRALVKERIFGVPGLATKTRLGATIHLDDESLDEDQPRPSPPKIASSPVMFNQLCSSLSQISLQSEEEPGNLTELVVKAQKCIDKAAEILLGRNKSPISHDSSIQELGRSLKSRDSILNMTGSGLRKKSISNLSSISTRSNMTSSSVSRPGSSCSSMAGARNHSTASITSRHPALSSLPRPSPCRSRRSVGMPLTSNYSSMAPVTTTKRNNINSNIAPNNAGASKIMSRRNSYGTISISQPQKLSVVQARTSANETKRSSAILPRNQANTSGIQRTGSSLNQSLNAPSLPIIVQPNTRKSLSVQSKPRFGYNNKKP